jgi:acylphosphatase
MSNLIGVRAYVSGKVQGVWYRDSTRRKAEVLLLNGWARNLTDGRVEVVAFGEQVAIAEFVVWLKQGPPLAKVEAVQSETIAWQACDGFAIL